MLIQNGLNILFFHQKFNSKNMLVSLSKPWHRKHYFVSAYGKCHIHSKLEGGIGGMTHILQNLQLDLDWL